MFCTDISAPSFLIFSDSVPDLLYYSHIPTGIIALIIGIFVIWKNRTLISGILFFISIVFSSWLFLNLIIWTNVDSRIIIFAWSLMGMLMALLFFLCFYFVYTFINKKDINWKLKILLLFILLPFILLNKENTSGLFDLVNCEAIEGTIYSYAVYFFEFAIAFWILIYAIYKYRKVDNDLKKQIIYLTLGIELFLFSFFVTGFLASYLAEKGVSYAFEIEQYGLFGMTFFMGVLAYLIVKYKAFNIKLLAAQALVVSLVLILASELFFAESATNQILILVTLLISVGMGYLLVKSVKLEVQRKEELQMMSEKLAGANDQLRKLDNAKSEFISIASHQLRTPLTAIKGFVSLLLEGAYGAVEAKVRDVLNKVYLSNERMVELVENLLNISRIESGRMEFDFKKWKVEEILNELRDTFYIAAKNKGLNLDFKFPAYPLPEIEIDGMKVREVISNFIDNALKYTKEGGVTVSVESANMDQEPGESVPSVKITVSDTGLGMPKDELPYLFAKFSRGKDTKRLHVGGTGLGLYVGKSIIEVHHGRVWAESEGDGLGSNFFIEIPVSQEKFQRRQRVEEFIKEI